MNKKPNRKLGIGTRESANSKCTRPLFVFFFKQKTAYEIELSGGESHTTNQRMELTGPIEGLRALTGRRAVAIHSDSAYVVNCFRDKWYLSWRANGWRNAQKKSVKNRDLWEALLELVERHDVTWHKVAGHSGHPLNDRADALARAAIPAR